MTIQDQDSVIWKTCGSVLLRDWNKAGESSKSEENSIILFIPITGDLHLITQKAGRVLKALAETPCSTLELFALFSDGNDVNVSSSNEFVESHLYPFEQLGIIQREN